MNTFDVLQNLRKEQVAFYAITLLELTGYLFPPPVIIKRGDAYDYIIVGGGTAGAVIATRLVQKEYNVLLIEAEEDSPFESTLPGLGPYLINSRVDWNYTTEADGYSFQSQNDRVLNINPGKMFGGTGDMSYMIYSRGYRYNFDDWSEVTGDPIWQWNNVLPYFIKSETINDTAIKNSIGACLYGHDGYIGVTRDQWNITGQVLEGFKQSGNPIIPDTCGNNNGYSGALLTINRGKRQDSGTRYLSHISESRYIAAAKNTLATKIIFHKNKTVAGVEVITDGNKKVVVNVRKEIIVAAGALKSPQLLMLSGIGPKDQLKKHDIEIISDLPVGKNLQDHAAVLLTHTTNVKVVDLKVDPGILPQSLLVGYASVNKSHSDKSIPEYTALGYTFNDLTLLIQFCASTFKFKGGMCNRLYDEAADNNVYVTLLGSLYANSRGQVSLRSTDPKDSPKIIHPSFSDDRDLDNFVDYIRDYLKVEQTEAFNCLGMKRVDLTSPKCSAFKKGSRPYWRCYILNMMVSFKSLTGTCALGSVVDSRLRVRGVKGLRVADASIMPYVVAGMTFNTVVMIGEKASDIIIEDAGEEYNSMKHEQVRLDRIINMPMSS